MIKLAAGYFMAAFVAYRSAESFGLCYMLRERWPGLMPAPPPQIHLPVEPLPSGVSIAPRFRRASVLQSNETVTSSGASSHSRARDEQGSISSAEDNLDTLTWVVATDVRLTTRLMRSSLALASEQDPSILLSTLLRILSQVGLGLLVQC
jgi:hypothetical protein